MACKTLLSSLSLSLPPDQAASCKGPLSIAEYFVAIKGMARDKASGLDGFPVEFYLKFWEVLGKDLVEVFNYCFDRGFLSKSQRRRVTVWILGISAPLHF